MKNLSFKINVRGATRQNLQSSETQNENFAKLVPISAVGRRTQGTYEYIP